MQRSKTATGTLVPRLTHPRLRRAGDDDIALPGRRANCQGDKRTTYYTGAVNQARALNTDLERVIGQPGKSDATGTKEGEMELTWKGYVIGMRVLQRKQAESAPDRGTKEVSAPPSPERRREQIEKQYLLASGNRYVAPSR